MAAMFFTFTGFIYSANYPVIDVTINTLQNMTTAPRQMWWFGGDALTDKQRANIYLQARSFEEAIADRNIKPQIFYEMLKLKSSFLPVLHPHLLGTEITRRQQCPFGNKNNLRHDLLGISFPVADIPGEMNRRLHHAEFRKRISPVFRYFRRIPDVPAYLSDDYTLLTPETMWYPVAEAPVYPAAPYKIKRDFTRYTLVVKARPGKTVISMPVRKQKQSPA